ncbi:hypothetical protein [Cellulophaga fucicola]|uniref:Lipocalin-like domain-containing protein n=1 Tax=Cellulophaga fucicola TaxID=76595 RepID=A0A1K1MP33_9FLAO|nr:hypothetical protein [Cellulophaga fucicola]SFW24841.1 hypothetical protein SAMN05660313_00759 [Cellulophaga fucicola]
MKKTFLIATLMLSSLFISCNSDDDNKSEQKVLDPIIGEWIQTNFTTNLIINGEEGPTNVEDLEDCEGNDFILNINEDGSFKSGKIENLDTGECDFQLGSWKNIGDGKYEFSGTSFTTFILTPEFVGNSFKLETESTDEDGTQLSRITYSKK